MDKQHAELLERVETLETKNSAPRLNGKPSMESEAAYMLHDTEGKAYPALRKSQKMAEYVRTLEHSNDGADFNLGQHVREFVTGRKVASGTALVPSLIGAQIFDDVRAQTVLIEAGATTIPISGPTNFARITADPTVIEHTEAANDITESSPTFAAVSANPKTLAALVPLSLEVVADSPNLDAALRTSIAKAFALKLDTLGLAVILADAAIPDSAVAHDPADWTKVVLAVGAAVAANQPLPTASIVTPANFATRNGQLASTAGSWLGKPPFLAGMVEYPTSSMTADISVLSGFERGVGIAMRQDLSIEILRFGKVGSGMHLLVATMRAAAIVIQPKALFIQKKVP
jgi:Phage capsid family